MSTLQIGNKKFKSRLFTGTERFKSSKEMEKALLASGSELVSITPKRVDVKNKKDDILSHLNHGQFNLLSNTSGAQTAEEAVIAAELARESLETNFIQLEIYPDTKQLIPDPVETLKAAEILVKKGFVVMPYIHADTVLCKRLEEVGTHAVMLLGSPKVINKGIKTADFLEIIINQSNVPVVVDVGVGAPSHAAYAMELGADAVLVSTAIALADDPVQMAIAFKLAVEAVRMAYDATLGRVS